jgi:ribosomal protein L24E
VTHDFPHVGKDIGAVPVLKELVEAGNQLILWTMRDEKYLAAALRWCSENEIRLYSYQRNPTQDRWTRSPKCYAELYIDDAALGCPLKIDPKLSDRPFVDWEQVREELVNIGAL